MTVVTLMVILYVFVYFLYWIILNNTKLQHLPSTSMIEHEAHTRKTNGDKLNIKVNN